MNKFNKKIFVFILFFFLTPQIFAKNFTFTIHHFLGTSSHTHKEMIVPWTETITKESKGKIKFEIFPAMALGGKPNELYKQVRDGVVDIVWTLPGYTAGVFPRVEAFELAGVHLGSARATNLALQDTTEFIKDDFKAIHPLLIHTHSGNALHLVHKKVTKIIDLKGLKLRTPSRTGAWLIESWGAEPVGMPVPALPQALSKKVIGGALIPFEIAISLKVADLTSSSVELANGERFGTSIFLFAMNKKSYNSLPANLKKIIDKNSGRDFSERMGKSWDRIELVGKDIARKKGNPVIELSKKESKKFIKNNKKITDRWIKEVAKKNIDGKKILQAAKKAVAKYSK